MTTIAREQLIEHAQNYIAQDTWLKEKFGEAHKTPATVELARIALASLEAEQRRNPVLAYADSYRDIAKQGVESIPVWNVITDLERNIAPLFTRQAPPVPAESCNSRLLSGLELPVSVVVNSAIWRLHSVNFVHDARDFSFYIYATSMRHAAVMVADIRKTAELDKHEIVAFSREKPDDAMLAELELLTTPGIH